MTVFVVLQEELTTGIRYIFCICATEAIAETFQNNNDPYHAYVIEEWDIVP